MSRICSKCKSKCLIIPLSCVLDGLTILSSDLDTDKIKAAMDVAQLTYLVPLLSSDCFKELCTALDNSELPDSDPNYEPLSEAWGDFVDQATELIVVATEFVYASKVGFGVLKKAGFLIDDSFDKDVFFSMLAGRKAELLSLQGLLKEWIEENKSLFSCYQTKYSACDDGDDDSFSNPFPDIMVI